MTLEEWIAHERAELEKFASMWRRENHQDPEIWPLSLDGAGEWDEQYRAHQEYMKP